jgi:hypothetical protein
MVDGEFARSQPLRIWFDKWKVCSVNPEPPLLVTGAHLDVMTVVKRPLKP